MLSKFLPGQEGARGCLSATPPIPLICNRGQFPPLSLTSGPSHPGTPAPCHSLKGIPPKAPGGGDSVFCFSSSFLSRENGTIAQAPAPHPPHRFLRFLLPLSQLPASAPDSAPSPVQLPAGEERAGGGGFVGEEGARDCTPTPLQFPCFPPRVGWW